MDNHNSTALKLSAQDFPILQSLSPLNMKMLNSYCSIMHVSKGVEVLHEGDTSHDVYFIMSGAISIARQSGSQLKVIAKLKKGDLYGEFGFLRKRNRFASVYTSATSVVIRVEISAIQQVVEADPGFKKSLEKLLTERMLNSFFFSHPVFHTLPQATRSQLVQTLPTRYFEAGKYIFHQGEAPDGIYLILSGEAEILFRHSSSYDVLLEVRRNDDILGEVANKNGSELAYSAVSVSGLDALFIAQNTMSTLQSQHPEIYKKLEHHLNQRMARTIIRLKENMAIPHAQEGIKS